MSYQVVNISQVRPGSTNNGLYIPSTRDISMILAGLNSMTGTEITLPGIWSPQLWLDDLFTFPCLSKMILQQSLVGSLTTGKSYRQFFLETRGYPRPGISDELWKIFETGSIMIGFETIFLKLVRRSDPNLTPGDIQIINLLKELGPHKMYMWNRILQSKGYSTWDTLGNSSSAKSKTKIIPSEIKQNVPGIKIGTTYKPPI